MLFAIDSDPSVYLVADP